MAETSTGPSPFPPPACSAMWRSAARTALVFSAPASPRSVVITIRPSFDRPARQERVDFLADRRRHAAQRVAQLVVVRARGQDRLLRPLHARRGDHLHGPGDLRDVPDRSRSGRGSPSGWPPPAPSLRRPRLRGLRLLRSASAPSARRPSSAAASASTSASAAVSAAAAPADVWQRQPSAQGVSSALPKPDCRLYSLTAPSSSAPSSSESAFSLAIAGSRFLWVGLQEAVEAGLELARS